MAKIGDTVRYMDMQGGGKVVAIKDKYTLIVEDDEFGMEMPVSADNVVVVGDSSDLDSKLQRDEKRRASGQTQKSVRQQLNDSADEEDSEQDSITDDNAEPSLSLFDTPEGEQLNVKLAFTQQSGGFDLHIINDDNYYLHYLISTRDDSRQEFGEDKWITREHGVIESHTQETLNRIDSKNIGDWERISVQILAFKADRKSADRKPAFDVMLHISPTRFCNSGSFTGNDYLSSPALIVDVIKKDRSCQTAAPKVNAEQLAQAMTEPHDTGSAPRKTVIKPRADSDLPLEIDLHIEQLLDSTDNMTPKEILDFQIRKFREVMNANRKTKGKKIVFIHGKGNGVLRKEIWKELTLDYPTCDKQDASFLRYGFGATLVTIR